MYDSLNRLKSAEEISNSVSTWKQTYAFDRYGNRRFDQANTSQPASFVSPNVTNPTMDVANNRFMTGQGYVYDLAGNILQDAEGRSFQYDAENKQQSASNQSGTVGQYSFDGDGKRVKKISTTETTVFVYDAGGKLVAEYANQISQTPQVSYLTTDHLGSPRINTDANGAVIARHDYHPFGEEITGTGGRTVGLGYASDDVRKKFTGFERDQETSLDFAEARMLNSSIGRFGTPDPYNIIFEKEKGEDDDERSQIFISFVSNPQRWNMYVYVLNNPLSFTDPDGRTPKTINVFLALPELTAEGLKEWEKFKSKAEKQGITVNIYKITDGTATPEKFLASIKAKDTVTIFTGHSYSIDGQKVGVEFHNGGVGVKGKAAFTADGVDIQNDAVVVFSCGFGKAFDNLASSNGAVFVSLNNGPDHKTSTDAVNQAGLRFAQSIGERSFGGVVAEQSNLSNATRRAQSGVDVFPYPNNKGDIVAPRVLPPAKRKR